MRLQHDKTLITGKPGVGKTTLVQKIIEQMGSVNMAGFYSSEIRPKGSRLGFELRGLNGKRRTMAHVDINSIYRTGKYGVDTAGFKPFFQLGSPSLKLQYTTACKHCTPGRRVDPGNQTKVRYPPGGSDPEQP
jgi:nucleoside-triphosphatase THEP1